MSDPNVRKGYTPMGKKRKAEKLEMAVPSTEPVRKNIVINKPAEPAAPKARKPRSDAGKVRKPVKKIVVNTQDELLEQLVALAREKTREVAASALPPEIPDDVQEKLMRAKQKAEEPTGLLRELLLRPNGIGTAMLLQKGLLLAKEQWIDGGKDKNSVLTILELTKKQQTHLKSNGETSKSGAYISVGAVEANKKETDDLLTGITGQEGGLELYHGGGVGSPHAFRMRLKGSAKEKRETLVGVSKWLEKVPSVAAIRELYDKDFSGQRAEMATSEAAAKKDTRVSGATEWLGHPLTAYDFKDVVRSWKALQTKYNFKYTGITELIKKANGDPAELISRFYSFLTSNEGKWSKAELVKDEFKKSLNAKGFWVENVKRLPPDLGANIGSFLNLPKGVMDDLIARTRNNPQAKTKAKAKRKMGAGYGSGEGGGEGGGRPLGSKNKPKVAKSAPPPLLAPRNAPMPPPLAAGEEPNTAFNRFRRELYNPSPFINTHTFPQPRRQTTTDNAAEIEALANMTLPEHVARSASTTIDPERSTTAPTADAYTYQRKGAGMMFPPYKNNPYPYLL